MTKLGAPRGRGKSAAPAAPKKRGRPRSRLPDDVIDRLGPVPTTPLKRAEWYAQLLAEIAELEIRGLISEALSDRLRAVIKLSTSVMPLEAIYAAEEMLRQEQKNIDSDDDGGPDLEEDDGAVAQLRRVPP